MKIQIINGPNLNLLGTREPTIYGSRTFEDELHTLRSRYPDITIDYYQSNIEGELINKLQEVGLSSKDSPTMVLSSTLGLIRIRASHCKTASAH